ncbi:DUF922 domain-containing protein [Leeuwenhoekiella sp. NPDC079379]|uniref:DUF922 domain-containing protein n=1 Tax=Leeuwenhoekiella sp. NPDC079379 TaxID=3364122 RepID=UPI0037CBFBB4
MLRLFYLIVCAALFISVQKKEYRFAWDANNPLEWSDFRATPERGSAYAATANSGLSHKYTINSEGYLVKKASVISANFYPNLSWYKPKLIDENTLAHEQTHFDISELHARLLRKAIAEYRFTDNSKAEIQKIYKSIEAQRRAMQIRFDKETNHSQNKEIEQNWESFMRLNLQKLNSYK